LLGPSPTSAILLLLTYKDEQNRVRKCIRKDRLKAKEQNEKVKVGMMDKNGLEVTLKRGQKWHP
jgi:hypothetical protein